MITRIETQLDIEQVDQVVEAAFGRRDEVDLVRALRDGGSVALSLVAVADDVIVGQVLFSKLQEPRGSLALAPVSVIPGQQKLGIGSTLIREGLRQLAGGEWQAIFLLGDPTYYSRFGFSVEAAAEFETPYPHEYFMALEMTPGGLAKPGPVVFAEPFLALG